MQGRRPALCLGASARPADLGRCPCAARLPRRCRSTGLPGRPRGRALRGRRRVRGVAGSCKRAPIRPGARALLKLLPRGEQQHVGCPARTRPPALSIACSPEMHTCTTHAGTCTDTALQPGAQHACQSLPSQGAPRHNHCQHSCPRKKRVARCMQTGPASACQKARCQCASSPPRATPADRPARPAPAWPPRARRRCGPRGSARARPRRAPPAARRSPPARTPARRTAPAALRVG